MEPDYFGSKVARPLAVDGALEQVLAKTLRYSFKKEAGVNRPSLPERFSVFTVFPQERKTPGETKTFSLLKGQEGWLAPALLGAE
jgi:hypothetical protein